MRLHPEALFSLPVDIFCGSSIPHVRAGKPPESGVANLFRLTYTEALVPLRQQVLPDTTRHYTTMSANSPITRRKRLDSWKEIAAFFGRDERTVNRWEKELGLPVHRLPGTKGRVFAYTEELSSWSAAPKSADAAALGYDSAGQPELCQPELGKPGLDQQGLDKPGPGVSGLTVIGAHPR